MRRTLVCHFLESLIIIHNINISTLGVNSHQVSNREYTKVCAVYLLECLKYTVYRLFLINANFYRVLSSALRIYYLYKVYTHWQFNTDISSTYPSVIIPGHCILNELAVCLIMNDVIKGCEVLRENCLLH